jgi:hypothetical protein
MHDAERRRFETEIELREEARRGGLVEVASALVGRW